MEKKIYQTPHTERFYMEPAQSLLGESVDKGEDNGEGEADAKKNRSL